jgi:hypothetical protein
MLYGWVDAADVTLQVAAAAVVVVVVAWGWLGVQCRTVQHRMQYNMQHSTAVVPGLQHLQSGCILNHTS